MATKRQKTLEHQKKDVLLVLNLVNSICTSYWTCSRNYINLCVVNFLVLHLPGWTQKNHLLNHGIVPRCFGEGRWFPKWNWTSTTISVDPNSWVNKPSHKWVNNTSPSPQLIWLKHSWGKKIPIPKLHLCRVDWAVKVSRNHLPMVVCTCHIVSHCCSAKQCNSWSKYLMKYRFKDVWRFQSRYCNILYCIQLLGMLLKMYMFKILTQM